MLSWSYRLSEIPLSLPADQKPDRITGVGRMRVRGLDKQPSLDRRKWKNVRKQSRQSRRRNRRGG